MKLRTICPDKFNLSVLFFFMRKEEEEKKGGYGLRREPVIQEAITLHAEKL